MALTGCISIKLQTAFQRAPGVVTLRGITCATDNNSSTYATCNASNVAETSVFDSDASTGLGQVMLGFRVPDGTVEPGSFPTEAGDANFSKNADYTAALVTQYPPPAGFHWVGYLSTPKPFDPKNQPADRETRFSPEFTLPAGTAGAPFAQEFKWRLVVGFRSLANVGQANDPVVCGSFCWDSPPAANVPNDLIANVSDFGVLKGTAPATAGQGETPTVKFPVSYSDLGGLGARELQLTATTDVPGATAQLTSGTLSVTNGLKSVDVKVPIPATAAPGTYTVTLGAADAATGRAGSRVARSNTATFKVVDKIAPAIRIGTPIEGATFTQGQNVVADYECTENANGAGIATCSGPVANGAAIDTASPGRKTFTVNASDKAANTSSLTRTYTVVAPVIPPAPQINISASFLFSSSKKFTKLSTFQVKNIPAGSEVTATCKGGSCPKNKKRKVISFTKKNAFETVTLKPWVGKKLKPGTRITIIVTKAGMVGMVKTIQIRAKKAPLVGTGCLQPGSKTAPAVCN
jgi:hypothetical protein